MKRTRLLKSAIRHRQAGAITMFTAVLILILLTEMIIYAVQVGVFEQRKSSNEMLQKTAFHTADSAIQQAKQFMATNALRTVSSTLANGWMVSGAERWQTCTGAIGGDTSGTHPCFAEPRADLRSGMYFYEFGGTNELPVDPVALGGSTTEQVTTHALLCMINVAAIGDPTQPICTTDSDLQDKRYFMITLLARGEADCVGENCGAEALISEKIGSFGPGGNEGGPGAPLTSRTMVPLSGTVEIVPNPNGGGVGVPVSSWVNSRTELDPDDPSVTAACLTVADPVDPISGSYATCERHEWYGVSELPADYKCPTNTCSCSKTEDRLISYVDGNERILGMDIVVDPNFPCDLWDYSFGVEKAKYELVKEFIPPDHILTDCDSLDAESAGPYWITGSSCVLHDQIGTKDDPVFLISLASETRVSAGAEVFGILFVSNAEDPDAEFVGNGHATIYGAAVMDGEMDNFNGTFQIVYLEDVIDQAKDKGAFGAVAGGWTDFHATWQ